MLVGSFSPFATTKAQRESTGDARPSIEERYRNRDDYVNRVRVAAQDLVARGFLLADDAAVIIQSAAFEQLVRAHPREFRVALTPLDPRGARPASRQTTAIDAADCPRDKHRNATSARLMTGIGGTAGL
jgi:hypothetical protein